MILYNKKFFSHLDLKNGFYHISEESVKYTAFISRFGPYEFLKMPFGLKVGPSRFQRFVQEVFKELIEQGDISVYLDDISDIGNVRASFCYIETSISIIS